MPRKGKVKKREINPDSIYNSRLIAKFINYVMDDGKKNLAENIVYSAMDQVKKKEKDDPLKLVEKAVQNVRPMVETKSRRVGGATYQVPVEVPERRSLSLAVRWIVKYAQGRPGRKFTNKLASEIGDAVHNRGGSVKKKEDVHRMAEANRAFAHYKW
ncbi:30S ribosomal protein S7 [bacterium]|nr:30S ribosomal protein S7 [bacterium]